MSIDYTGAVDAVMGGQGAGAPLAPPPSNVVPIKGPLDYDTAAGRVMDMQHGLAVQNLVDAQGSDPDRAAKALAVSRETGIAQPAAEENLEQATQAADLQKNVQALRDNPGLSAFVGANPLAARIAQDDFDKLGFIDRMTAALKSGASSALLTNQLGRLGNVKQAAAAGGAETPQTDAKIASLQRSIAAQPKLNRALGFAQNFTGFITGLVDNAIEGGAQGGLAGAVVGAGLGAAAGGVGAVPGAAAGALVGAGVGFNVDMARVAAGNAYLKMDAMRGADGQPLSEVGKQFGAIFTGAATYAIGTYASKIESALVGETAESLAAKAMDKALQSPTLTRALGEFAGSTLKGAAQGAGIMTAMEASSIIGEQIAKATSSGDFATDTGEIVERLADAAINGAALLGAMHGAMRGMSLYGDARSAIRAQGQAEMLRNIMTGATESKLRERDLQGFQEFMQRQTDGSPVESLYIPAEKVRELYQGARADPFAFVPDMRKQLDEAAATGGDVVIPTADFVAHLAGTPLAERLLPDMRVGADAMSLNEAKEFQAEYQKRLEKATAEAADKAKDVDSVQRIQDEVRQQATAAGYSDAVASRYAALYAARYATRGERLGIDPYEAFKQSGIEIRKGAEEPAHTAGAGFRDLEQPASDAAPQGKDAQTQELVALRKRQSILSSIMECLA
jgi:hypothetical protein